MKVISLGYSCYIKSLIQKTKYNCDTNIFDWMNSFYFDKLIGSIENNFNIFDNIIKSPLEVDSKSENVLYNSLYDFRLPHETNFILSRETYKRRFERFKANKESSEHFLFIRKINHKGRYGVSGENLGDNYGEPNYNRIMAFLPERSKIILITEFPLSETERSSIYNKFIIVDDVINPDHIAYGDLMKYSEQIMKCYNSFFDYIDTNYSDLDLAVLNDFIKNSHIRI